MPLMCECDTDGEWWHIPPDDFAPLKTVRRKRCASCKELIEVGADAGCFGRWRYAQDEVELRIYGDDQEIEMAPKFMCEDCTGLYFSLTDLGFCLYLGEDMRDLVKQYAEVYGPKAA